MHKTFEPDDPMELVGVILSGGDADQALDDIVMEFLLLGWQGREIMHMFRSPCYMATHQLYQLKGEAHVRDRVQFLAETWQRGWIGGGERDA